MKETIIRVLYLPLQAVGILFFCCLYILIFWYKDEDEPTIDKNCKDSICDNWREKEWIK